MGVSNDLKEEIVNYFDCTNLRGTKSKDWKRVQKGKLPNGETFREFHNAVVNRTVFIVGDDEDGTILEKDQIIYGFGNTEHIIDLEDGDEDGYVLVFETKDRFYRQGCLYDQHQQDTLTKLWHLPSNLDEVCENQFVASKADYNDLTIHITMKKLGFEFSRELTVWCMNNVKPKTAAPGPDLTVVLPGLTATPPSNPTPTARKITKFTNKNPVQVAAQQQAQLQQQQAAMMAQIGQMATSLGATGGVQIGGLHIPAATAPSSTAGQYPELANLQPAVQAAFVAQRIMGLRGLDQANPQWMDRDYIDNILIRHRNQQFDLDIERSNAIWLLYEEIDDGSGTVMDDLFAVDNEELKDFMDDYGILDQIDDLHDVEIVDDYQVYPAPYDLPVPPTAPYNNPPPAQHSRPAPMVGPASINARAGSFAAPATPPAAATPPPPPPGNASAALVNDSGDKWAEFCKEVFDTYELNKGNLPLDLTWYDRYRPREAQITGLGFSFVRREFTGIVIKMGYLDRDGELLETIDMPSAVLDELMQEWGGNWNIDDITQMVNKKKGENPETGDYYTSEGLWDDVKAFLTSEGWKEV